MMALHPLLRRQLKRLGLDPDTAGEEPALARWRELLTRVSRAYEEHDQENYLLERSQTIASEEMTQLYATLRADHALLDSRVQERTAALRLSEERLQNLVSLSADWIWEQDAELRFSYLSDSIEATFGQPPGAMLGKHRLITADPTELPNEATAEFEADLAARRPFRDFTYDVARPDGERRYVRISGEPVFDDAGVFQGYRGVGRDVTLARLAEQKVQQLASYDSLTGLPNRNMVLTELERAMARSRRQGNSPFAVFFIDLDRFKNVNDTMGHNAGDELLATMARRLSGALRENDLVARLGGDEFVVLLEGGASPSRMNTVARKLLTAIGEPVTLRERRFLLTGSIGIAQFPTDGEDATTLLQHADAAMYLAKEKGKNNVQFYTEELARKAARDFELESAIQLALSQGELALHYQPQMAIGSGRMVGVEALLRWHRPMHGLVMPMDFIPLAEERGLILPIGRWVIEAACRQIHQWRAAGLAVPRVAINLSAHQFASETLVSDIAGALARHEVAFEELEVELTESALMADPERASQVLEELHALGVRIAIDDFGTGYSSLSYLKRFPAQTLKIDRSFIDGLPAERDDLAITEAVIVMAHSLGLSVVAEGVETQEQLDALRRLGCDEAQGYLLGRPMAPQDLALRLAALSSAA